jgi:alkylation response protein AidB-like acyl-CoA dehydrogenase
VLGSATEAQKKQLFQSVLDGWRIGNAGPERGTKNTLELKARITADGDGYVINGQKFYSTGALFAHWVAVKALNDDGKQVWPSCAVAPGLRIVDWSGFGQRTTASGTVLLNNVPVDAELVVDNWKINEKPRHPGRLAADSSRHRRRYRPWRPRRRHRIRARTRARPWIDARSNAPAMTCT